MRIVYRLLRWRPLSPAVVIRGSSHSVEHMPQDEGFYIELNQRHIHQIFLSGVRFLKGDLDLLKRNLDVRDVSINVDNMVHLYQEYLQLLHQINATRQKRNIVSRAVQSAPPEKKEELINEGVEIKQTLTLLETKEMKKKEELMREVVLIPNDAHPDVPIGDESNARLVSIHGSKPEFSFPVRDHVELAEKLDLIDFKAASNASGHRFYYLKGAAARLEIGLVQYAMNKAISRGFVPVITPDIVRANIVEGCGFHPRASTATQVYQLHPVHGHLCLAGTAEIPLAGMVANTVLPRKDLPLKYVAFGRCFRAEAGGYGKAVKGLYRVHQFSKVELFGVMANETGQESHKLLEEILDLQKEICSELGFRYRVMEMPTKELGAPAYRKYDIEAWMPGRNEYGEVTSASNCTDFQSYRLGITYRNPDRSHTAPGKKYAHTVNGTACAIPRTIVTLLEQYQTENGNIELPSVLHPYVGVDTIS